MILAKVIGTAVSTIREKGYESRKILVVNPLDINGNLKGKSILAIDTVQAGVGDTVIIIDEGGSAKIVLGAENVTVRTIVAGIVDEINISKI